MIYLLWNRGYRQRPVPTAPPVDRHFNYASLYNATDALAARLFDTGFKFWTREELEVWVTEAIRTWNALTSMWRAEMVFPLTINTHWYDLTTRTNSLRPMSVPDTTILNQIEYHLLEPLTTTYPLSWTGSAQFSLTDILGAIQRRRDETLGVTGCTLYRNTVAAVEGRTFLPDTALDIRRVAWIPETGFGYSTVVLRPTDTWAKQSYEHSWTTMPERPPRVYMQSTQPPLSFDVDAVPPVVGRYEVLAVDAGTALSTGSATNLNVPNDWTWVIKWGALSDLLGKESFAKDALRADYCIYRYKEGLALMNDAPAALTVRLNNIPIRVDGFRNGDDFNAGWQAAAAGTPKVAYLAGLNLIGFGPMPDDSTSYSATVSVVRNAPVPENSADYIQVGREDYDVILDYAQHLAAFKMGGNEFLQSLPLYQKFMARAALYNSKIKALGQYQPPMYELSQVSEERSPRYEGQKPKEVLGG